MIVLSASWSKIKLKKNIRITLVGHLAAGSKTDIVRVTGKCLAQIQPSNNCKYFDLGSLIWQYSIKPTNYENPAQHLEFLIKQIFFICSILLITKCCG